MQIPVIVSNLMTPCLCKLVLLSHAVVLWQESLGSQHKIIQSVCTYTNSRTSYPRFILVLYLLSCPFYPSAFLCGYIPVLLPCFPLWIFLHTGSSRHKILRVLETWHCISYPIFIRKSQNLNLQVLCAVSKESMIRHNILKLQLAGSIIYFNSKLSHQEDFILRTTNIWPSAE